MFEMSSRDRPRGGHVFSDASFMDETDREVSSLTDRAFRSLCVGEEAAHSDAEFASSPAERRAAFVDDAQQHGDSATARVPGETCSFGPGRCGGAGGTFRSFGGAEKASRPSNGVIESTWQQKKSSSKVPALIRAFGVTECEGNGGVTAELGGQALVPQDCAYKGSAEAWDGSALLSIQKELSEFSSVYHQTVKGSSFPQGRNHFQSSETADSSAPSLNVLKGGSKCSRFKKLSARNFFLHSEFSPFQTWKDYNRLLFDREVAPRVLSPNQLPRWYDSPFYKELTAAHRNQIAQLEEKRSQRRQAENVVPADLPASTVRQKASAIEKRCESAMAANCPPWKRSQEPVRNKFPPNRPCTASPFSDKSRRTEDGLFPTGRASALRHKVQTVVDEQTSNSGTPFSISQLLTPVIPSRQETETSEILQYAFSPPLLDLPMSFECEPKQPPEVKPRNKYKAMTCSLLFNLKDNRKRVKSTYTPTTFKSLEIADHGKQPSQLDSLISKEGVSTPESWATASMWPNGKDLQRVSSPAQPPTNMPMVNCVKRAESSQSQDYFTLISPQTVNRVPGDYKSTDRQAQGSARVEGDRSGKDPPRKTADHETGSLRAPPHSFIGREHERPAAHLARQEAPAATVTRHVEIARVGGPREHRQEAGENAARTGAEKNTFTFDERGFTRTDRTASVKGDIAALLERDRQLVATQSRAAERQEAHAVKEARSSRNELCAGVDKGIARPIFLLAKDKEDTRNEPVGTKEYRKNEASEMCANDQAKNEVLATRQNSYAPSEELNARQEYRCSNHELYEVRENNWAKPTNQGLHPARGIQYNSSEAFGRKEHVQTNQEMPLSRENRLMKSGEFTEQAGQHTAPKTGDRSGSNYMSAINPYEKTKQGVSQHARTDNKHLRSEVFVMADQNPARQVQVAVENRFVKNAVFAGEVTDQVKQGLRSSADVRYAPIEEFARKDREMEKQKTIATGEVKLPVLVRGHELTRQCADSVGEDRGGASGVFTIGIGREARRDGEQGKYVSRTISNNVPEQTNQKVGRVTEDGTVRSHVTKSERGATVESTTAEKDVLASKQGSWSQSEASLRQEKDGVKPEAPAPRERGQTRQEMLTSKLKAHAEKEIFAIKEKEKTNATKQRESHAHGNHRGRGLPSPEHSQGSTATGDGNAQAAHRNNEALVDQQATRDAGAIKNAHGVNWPAKPGATTRAREHARNYVVTNTERISARQEELQSIARAKIEALALSTTQQRKPELAVSARGNERDLSLLGLRENTENAKAAANASHRAEANKEEVHAAEGRDGVKVEALAIRGEQVQLQSDAVNESQAKSALLSRERGVVSQVTFFSEHVRNERRERERDAANSDAPAHKEEARVEQDMPPTAVNVRSLNSEQHEDKEGVLMTAVMEHAISNDVLRSESKVNVEQDAPPSAGHIRSKMTASNETLPVRDRKAAVEKEHTENEFSALRENHQAKPDSSCLTRINARKEELPPVTHAKTEAAEANGVPKAKCELANQDGGKVTCELPLSIEKENIANETTAVSEIHLAESVAVATGETEDDALSKEEGISLKQEVPSPVKPKQEVPSSVQHTNQAIAAQENDQGEKEHDNNDVLQSKERGSVREEEPPVVEHDSIEMIANDETTQVREIVAATEKEQAKNEGTELCAIDQVKLDSPTSEKNGSAEDDALRSPEELNVEQEELPQIMCIKTEVVASSESLPAKHEPAQTDRDGPDKIPQMEKDQIENAPTAIKENHLAKPEIVSTREEEEAKSGVLETEESQEEPPSVEHIRIRIIPHNGNQPIRESIVTMEKETVPFRKSRLVKLDSFERRGNESAAGNALGSPERVNARQGELPPITTAKTEDTGENSAERELANKEDRANVTRELPRSIEKENIANETTAVSEIHLATSVAFATGKTEDDKNDELAKEERIGVSEELPPPVEHVTNNDNADCEIYDHKQGVAVTAEEVQVNSDALVSEENVSFQLEGPSMEHIRTEAVSNDENHQVVESIISVEEEEAGTAVAEFHEGHEVKLDPLTNRENEQVQKNAPERMGVSLSESPSEGKNDSGPVDQNNPFEHALAETERNSVVNETPPSRGKEIAKNEPAEIDENRPPEPEALATRDETEDAKTSVTLAKRERTDRQQEVAPSVEYVKNERLQASGNHLVRLGEQTTGREGHGQSEGNEETVINEKTGNAEKTSERWEKSEGNHQPKHELANKATDVVPQPREDKIIHKGVAVTKNHEGQQELLPTRKTEDVKNVPGSNKAVCVKQEEHTQVTLFDNNPVKRHTSDTRKEHPASKEMVSVGQEQLPATPHSITINDSRQASHDLGNRDRGNVTHVREPTGKTEHLENETTAAKQEVNKTREKDAKKEALVMNKVRVGVIIQALPPKEEDDSQNAMIADDDTRQGVLANRSGNSGSESLPKTKCALGGSTSPSESHRGKQEVLPARERGHAQGETVPFDENHQVKLDALARRRKEKAEQYVRANMDGINTSQGEHLSTTQARVRTIVASKNHLAKQGLAEDRGHGVRETPSSGKEKIVKETPAVDENLLVELEAHGARDEDCAKRNASLDEEAVSVRRDLLASRDRGRAIDEAVGVGDRLLKHALENKRKGSVRQAVFLTENIRHESVSVKDNHHAKRDVFAKRKGEESGNCEGVGTDGTRGSCESIPRREKDKDDKQVTEREKDSARMETKDREHAKREAFSVKGGVTRKGELSTEESGPTVREVKRQEKTALDYFLEKDRDSIKNRDYAFKERGIIKPEGQATKDCATQEVHATKDHATQEAQATKDHATQEAQATKDHATQEVHATKDHATQEVQATKDHATQEAQATKDHATQEVHATKDHATQEVHATKDHATQEVHATKYHATQEVLVLKEKELVRNEGFAVKGKVDTAIDNITTKDRDRIQNRDYAVKEMDRATPEVPIRKNVQAENIFANRERHQIRQVSNETKPQAKQELIVKRHHNLYENVQERARQEVLVRNDHAKQETPATKARIPARKEIFVTNEMGENALDSLSKKHTDDIKSKAGEDQDRASIKPEELIRKYQNLSENAFTVQEKERTTQEIIATKGNGNAKPEVLPIKERVHANPETNELVTDMANDLGRKEALSPQTQGYHSKNAVFAWSGRDNLAKGSFVPRGNGKDKMEAFPNKQEDMTGILIQREKEKEMLSMREQRAKERAAAREERYKQEALPKHGYAKFAALPAEEKSATRREAPALFDEENTRVPANKQQDRMDTDARDRLDQNAAPALPLQVKGYRGASMFSRMLARANVPSRESYLSVGDAPQSPEEESKAHPALRVVQSPAPKSSEDRNAVEEVKRDAGKLDGLQYYAISSHECKADRRSAQRLERLPGTEESEPPHGEPGHCLMDYAKPHTPTPRSNSSSPSLGKILFKVKDNTLRASPVTKTVKPRFHKTFGDDLRLGSSRESLSGSEKGDDEGDRPKEAMADVPVLQNVAPAWARAPRSREAPAHGMVHQHAAEFLTAREPRSYYRRNQQPEQDERTPATAASGDGEGQGAGVAVRVEEACERPESACSDAVRPFGKPPSVPPKSEKALRRAKKLTTRRTRRAEATADSPSPVERLPLRSVASAPSSPIEGSLPLPPAPAPPRPLLAPPLPPQFRVEPGYVSQAPGVLAQPFPVAQRKLLQDPNSGQYFVVSVPVPVKTKMFFDPETGTYVQLSVQQAPQGPLSNASSMELLSPPPYVLYPGFLPVPVSSLPPLRSASQMSAPATLMGDQEKHSDPWGREVYGQSFAREAPPYIEPAYAPRHRRGEKPSLGDQTGSASPRDLDIIPMSELEDFAMENT